MPQRKRESDRQKDRKTEKQKAERQRDKKTKRKKD
jgi:hypothetical protein